MEDLIKSVLEICRGISCITIALYLLSLVELIIKIILKKSKKSLKEMNPIYMVKASIGTASENFTIVLALITVVGIIYMLAFYKFQTTEIGSFFEKRGEFEEQYEALVYLENKPIFCIADVRKCKDETGQYYVIDELHLPYGKFYECYGCEYDPSYDRNEVYIGFYEENYKIEIGNVATEKSLTMLEAEVVSAYGPLCASRKSDKYHLNWCPSAANIKSGNKIFFESEEEANLLMFEACGLCFD